MKAGHRALLVLVVFACVGLASAQSGRDHVIRRLELKEAAMVDVARLISEISGVNVITSPSAATRTVTAYLRDVTAAQAIDTICRVNGLWYREDVDAAAGFRVMTTDEFQRDVVVARDDQIRTFTMLNPNAIMAAIAVRDVYGQRVRLSLGIESDDRLFEQDTEDSGSGSGSFGGGGLDSGGLGGNGRFGGATNSRFGSSGSFTRSGSTRDDVFQGELTADQLAALSAELDAGGENFNALLNELDTREAPIYVSVVRQQNVIIVRTSDAAAMDDVASLVKELDRPTPQVFLVVKVLQVTLGDDFRSVFDIEVLDGGPTPGTGSDQAVFPLNTAATTGPETTLGTGNFPLETNTLVYQFLDENLRVRLQLLETEDRVTVVSSPVLLASNNLTSRLFVGEERVLTTGVSTDVVTPGTGATTTAIEPETETRDIGNTLLIRPKINADRTVTLVINQDTSTVLPGNATIPVPDGSGGVTAFAIDTVSTASLETVLVAQDGLTVAIGGLIQDTTVEAEQKVPFLGDLPFLGALFRRTVDTTQRTELMVLVTPYVISTPQESQAVTLPVARDLSTGTRDHFDENGTYLESSVYNIDGEEEPASDG